MGRIPTTATFTFQRGLVGTNNVNSAEIIVGTDGNDTINGNGGFYDGIYGGSGNDTINGGTGSDWLRGGGGNDNLNGAAGNDNLRGDDGYDILNGGVGIDRADYRNSDEGVTVNLALGKALNDGFGTEDTLIGMENVRGSGFDDSIIGDGNDNGLRGMAGDDTLTGAGGNDTLQGEDGFDTYRFNIFGEGNDVIQGFDALQDKLAFADILDVGNDGILDDLAGAITGVVDNGVGADVVVTFNGGATLTFAGAGIGTINDITQLVADPNTQIGTF